MDSTISRKYFQWVCDFVYDSANTRKTTYKKLLAFLHGFEFTYTIAMDENRAVDGIALRRRFGLQHHYSEDTISEWLDYAPCSVLEMMVALSVRCEETIMDNPDIGNRTGIWFWEMIVNSGLSAFHDGNFSSRIVDKKVSDILDHNYDYDGKGGLFTVSRPRHDMREVEIWYQCMWYLNEFSKR